MVALLAGSVSAHAQIYTSGAAHVAVLGGVAGAIIGNNSGGRHAGEGAIIGAVAGALIGNAADNSRSRTVYVQSAPPCPTPAPQVVYVQQAAPVPVQQVVYYQQAPQVVCYQPRPQPVVYVDAWGRPIPAAYGYRYSYGHDHWRR